jgi:hypothetical protein
MKILYAALFTLKLTSVALCAEEINPENAHSQLISLGNQMHLNDHRSTSDLTSPISIKVSASLIFLDKTNFDSDACPAEWERDYKVLISNGETLYPVRISTEKEFMITTYLNSGLEGHIFKIIDKDTQEAFALKVYTRPGSNTADVAMAKYRFHTNVETRQKIRELCNLPLYIDELQSLTVFPLLDISRNVISDSLEYRQHQEEIKKALPHLQDRSISNVMYDFAGNLKAIDF